MFFEYKFKFSKWIIDGISSLVISMLILSAVMIVNYDKICVLSSQYNDTIVHIGYAKSMEKFVISIDVSLIFILCSSFVITSFIGCILINPYEPGDNPYNLGIGFVMIGCFVVIIGLIGAIGTKWECMLPPVPS